MPYQVANKAGCGSNGKPVYVSQRTDADLGVAPYLYSPARRNSWFVGADSCCMRLDGGPPVSRAGRTYPGRGIRSLARVQWLGVGTHIWDPCAAPVRNGCRRLRDISGSSHQQHTHGVYARTQMHCDGKPVYMQQTGVPPLSLEEQHHQQHS